MLLLVVKTALLSWLQRGKPLRLQVRSWVTRIQVGSSARRTAIVQANGKHAEWIGECNLNMVSFGHTGRVQ